MAKKLMKQERGKCVNQGKHPMCTRRKVAMCVLYENPYRAPGPCLRAVEEEAVQQQSAKRKGTLIEAILRRGLSRGPLTDRFLRYLLRVKWDPEQIAGLNKELLRYSFNGNAFGVRGALFLGAEPDTRDGDRKTPLMRVAELGHIYTMSDVKERLAAAAHLLRYKADRNATDNNGMTAKDIAQRNQFLELADVL